MDVRAPILPVLLLVLCVFAAGCTSSAAPAPTGDTKGDTQPPADPPPDPPTVPPGSPPPSGGVGNSTLDPGFNLSTNVVEVCFVGNEGHDTGDAAVTANSGNRSYLYFVNNHVHHTNGTGEGFYLGANFGDWITHHRYVVGNRIHDTGDIQGGGVEIKDGSYACVIADNWIERTNRPGIIVYANNALYSASGSVYQGSTGSATVAGNVILGSLAAFDLP